MMDYIIDFIKVLFFIYIASRFFNWYEKRERDKEKSEAETQEKLDALTREVKMLRKENEDKKADD